MCRLSILIFQFILFSVCFCEFTVDKDKFLSAFVNHLNSLADQPFVYEEAEFIRAQEIKDNEYCIEIKVKASDQNDASYKYQNCTGNIIEDGEGQLSVDGMQCSDLPEGWTEATDIEELVTDLTTNNGPIQLENEVQTENMSTSGERFIAVPRERSVVPCIGCASYVDPNAVGVKELASMGVRQLDRHEPATRHTLNNVLLVERQVQVVGGVRYIITLTVDYDNCTANETENCNYQKACRISILEKPWQKLPDGSKFRAILSNNCTEEWLFNEDSSLTPNFNNQSNDILNPTAENYDNSDVSTPEYIQTDANDDIVKAVHNKELQGQPTADKTLTDEQIRDIEKQIIPLNKVNLPTNNHYYSVSDTNHGDYLAAQTVANLDAAKPSDGVSSTQQTLSDDKKKAVDDFINFFDFSGYKDKSDNVDLIRMKRDYSSDIQFLNLAESYQDMKTKIKNAQFIQKLAQSMVDYLNNMDDKLKTRKLKEVISAEEEIESNRRYFYIQASLSTPCLTHCKNKEVKMCSGIIDGTEEQPSVLYTVCNPKQKKSFGQAKQLRQDDPIMLKFLKKAMKKIDEESKQPYALRIKKILSASTQKVSGRLTKISVETEYTECFKSVPLFRRNNCTALENLGFKLCDIQIIERHWLKETKIMYECTDRPVDEIFVADLNNELDAKPARLTVDDPQVLEIVQEALQRLELESNRNNKQKLVKVKSVSTQLVAGLLTNVVFTIGYTTCTSDYKHDLNTCELLENEPLRTCAVEVWERQWLDEGRKLNITCEKLSNRDEKKYLTKRKKRDADLIVGGPLRKNVEDPKYKKLAEESVQKYCKEAGLTVYYKIMGIDEVTVQVVAGTLTKIKFHMSPTNCQTNTDGQPLSSVCVVQNTGETTKCESKIWERLWLKDENQKKIIDITCSPDVTKSRKKRSIQSIGYEWEQNPNDYIELANDCLTNYMFTYGLEQHYKLLQVNKAVKVNTTGDLIKVNFVAAPTNCKVKNGYPISAPCEIQDTKKTLSCHADVWAKLEMNSRVMNVNCQKDDEKFRKKRDIPGGYAQKDVNNPIYITLSEKSLTKYLLKSGVSQHHKVSQINYVYEQIVSGTKTIIDFTASPTDCEIDKRGNPTSSSCEISSAGNILHCNANILEQPWLGKETINVGCHSNKPRKKRAYGGEVIQNSNDPKYIKLAEDSWAKYVLSSVSAQQHVIPQILIVTTQVVSGILTKIDFKVQTPGGVLVCHSEIWEQSWHNKRDIDVTCSPSKTRRRREVPLSGAVRHGNYSNYSVSFSRGGVREQDPTSPKYIRFAEMALKKYQRSKNSNFLHKVIEVKHVQEQAVAGKKYKIDFISAPTTCSSNASNANLCDVVDPTIIYCHTEIWDRPWLRRTDITVAFCNTEDIDGHEDTEDPQKVYRKKRSLSHEKESIKKYSEIKDLNFDQSEFTTGGKRNEKPEDLMIEVPTVVNDTRRLHYLQKSKLYNSEEYLHLAEESLREYERKSESEVLYKVVKIYYVNEDDNIGIRIRMDFSASPSNCSSSDRNINNNCQIIKPNSLLSCHSSIRFTLMLKGNLVRSIEVKCTQKKNRNASTFTSAASGGEYKARNKRQVPLEETVEEELMYSYADRVMSQVNTELYGKNLYKLITIHDVRRTMHMRNVPLVRMYLEVAKSYCLQGESVNELSYCSEIEGLDHILCFARVWPARYDELVIENVDAVCEDSPQRFLALTGFTTNMLLFISVSVLNRDGPYKYVVKPTGQTMLTPTLDYSYPFRMTFIISETNCIKKDADKLGLQSLNETECIIGVQTPKMCWSQMYMTSNTRTLSSVNVTCSRLATNRPKRSIPLRSENVTNEDITIQSLVQEALHQLEMVSVHRYKQRVLVINRFSTRMTTVKETTIDFDVGYTNCLKFEWVDNITDCEFLEHLPRRHCVASVFQKYFVDSRRDIVVNCDDDETPLEANMELETAQTATTLSNEVLKHIEYKYPHPRRQIVVRIFSLEKQMIAGIHYRLKMEVGYSTCMALSLEDNCKLDPDQSARKFCRANVWLRPWTNHPPSYRVTCDYQDNGSNELFHEIQAEQLFSHFIMTYKPSYMNNHMELQMRYQIFKENVKKIHELNVYEMGTARYAVTRFADLSDAEFKKKYLGLNPKLHDENQVPMPDAEIPAVDIPSSFDWREHDAVTEVKDQGSCGSCWAFSVTGNIEGQWKRHSGKLLSLSEQELVDCDKLDQGCNGGLPDNAYRAIEQLGGLETEADYPYEGDDDKCIYNSTLSRVQISGAVNISSNETAMAQWLVQNGPISIGINANAMQFYVAGVSHPWKMLCNPSNLDHGVLIVGYGEKDYPLFKKKLPYWIVKNSWGKGWGEQGYYRVYRGDGTCGVNQMASSAII